MMRVAIIHDDLMRRGGAEQVVLSMLKAYPNADLYTLCYRPELTYPEFKNYKIKSSFFNRIAKNERIMKILFFPIGLLCMKWMSVWNYDVVLISNTYCAKYASIDKRSKVFIYTYTPFRIAWDPSSYQEYNLSKGLKRFLFDQVVRLLRTIDRREAKKGNYFLSMTKETVERVKKAGYSNEVSIIHPPVKCSNFHVAINPLDYYLIVSRLEFYKNVDLAIRVFNKVGKKLIIVGNGSKKKELMSLAENNIEFRSGLSKEQLGELYSNCRAFIFPQHEDYGITPLEANASGRPVIAYGKGGVLETMIPYNGQSKKFTSLFFKEQTEDCLTAAIHLFETLEVDSAFIRSHAEQFDESTFVEQLKKYVDERL